MTTRNCKLCKKDFNNSRRLKKYSSDYCVPCSQKLSQPERNRRWKLKNKYGITQDYFKGMLKGQNNQCKICKSTFKTEQHAHIDHNHVTGKVRGLLCMDCNTGIGKLKDDPNLLRKAIAYLKKV